MQNKVVQLSKEFKFQAIKAISAIFLFILSYFILFILSLILTIICIVGGVALIVFKPMFITLAFGIGLASLGVLILIFLVKFIFKSHKVDRSHLVEIEASQEPDLFELIDEITQQVGTKSPKKVYLSSEVNAAVFYDSSFWSMFLPIEKNLQIGLGLVNAVTKQELKAILSHEFGHFSQKTMKVGSYVYNVNQVIFNMLFDNESYQNLVQSWANVSNYFRLFVVLALRINQGIQWILRKLYAIVNKSYLSLSREMEFHADAIAASVTGYQPLKNSLLRLSLADRSFSDVLNFYNEKIADNIKTDNIYLDHYAVVRFQAEFNRFQMQANLPIISTENQSKYNKSKLVIKNQWASHPTTEERVKRLEETGFIAENEDEVLANTLFKDIKVWQELLTKQLFKNVTYAEQTILINTEEFISEYKQPILSDSFSDLYNGYYNSSNPTYFDIHLVDSPSTKILDIKELFSDEKVDLIYLKKALENDLQTLDSIANNQLGLKTFDYDGMKYSSKDAVALIEKLKPELENIKEQIKQNDIEIFRFFNQEAQNKIYKKSSYCYIKIFLNLIKNLIQDKRFAYNYTQIYNLPKLKHLTTK